MPDKDDLLSKIRALDQLEKEAMTPPPQQGGIPVIRTLESDTNELIKNDKLDKVHILAQQLQSSTDNQMDSIIQQTVKQTQTKKMIILGSVGAMLLIIILGLVWFIVGSDNEPAPVVTPPTNNQQTIPPITDTSPIDTTTPEPPFTIPPQQTIVDVWPAAREIAEFTGSAKKEENHIIIDVTHFSQVYAYLIQNEVIFNSLAQTFGYMTLDPFRDATIDNKNMRVADGGTGALVYGFIRNNTALLISNSVNDWIQTANGQ